MDTSKKQDDVPPDNSNVFSASARGASYLILLQLFTRVLTFTFNQLVLRHTSPQIFGFATIQLELLSSTLLFLSREGFRIALQRRQKQQTEQDAQELQTTVNLAYIPLVTGLVGAVGGCWVFWRRLGSEVKGLGGEGWTIVLVGVAAVLELSCEVCFVVGQRMLMFRMRTMAEGTAVVARCLTTYGVTIWLLERGLLGSYGVLAFGLGQLAYATVLAGVYFFIMSKRVGVRNLMLRKVVSRGTGGGGYWFHGPTLWLAFSVTGQSLFKHVLTEGDKLVLTLLTTPYTQGLYALVSNYGKIPLP
jgi:oligosaccharide translocation protein RFT1